VESLHAVRARAAVSLLERHQRSFRRIAQRISLCPADADDALQRAVVILLTKAPELERDRLAAWMNVVTKREALAVRQARERLLGQSSTGTGATADGLGELSSERADPVECLERGERVADARRALAELREDERLALVLQAQGYSYAEICSLLGWTYTKVNRCLAEGRATLRRLDPA
jgi:RNA polymerase sigma factor (sigma-70 family)